jgi:hypothetical protein
MPADCIRIADPEADRALLTDLLSRNLSPDAGGRRFEWLYRENPHGLARVWVATEDGTGRALGVAAAFPRKFLTGDSFRTAFVLGDFCIDPQHRSLGLALQLQRACLKQINSAPRSLFYDFPSDRMMAIYRRMQIPDSDRMIRWAKPLRTDRKFAARVKSPSLAGSLAAPFNQLLKWKDSATFPNGPWTITHQEGLCSDEFTELARSIGSSYGFCVERSAEYLNWRYLQHPLLRHELLTARRGKDLQGYVIFSHNQDDGKIVDLFGFSDTSMWTALVGNVVALFRDQGLATASFPALGANPWTGLFAKWGFRPREAAPVVVHAAPTGTEADPVNTWFLTDGDRES